MTNALNTAETSFAGPLNTVVNCAGIGIATRTFHAKKGAHSLEEFERVIKVIILSLSQFRRSHVFFFPSYMHVLVFHNFISSWPYQP